MKLVLGDEGHNMKQGAAIMPDALRWLWRDYPAPVTVHEPEAMQSARLGSARQGVFHGFRRAPREQVGGNYGSVTGIAGDKEGNVYFTDAGPPTVFINRTAPEKSRPSRRIRGVRRRWPGGRQTGCDAAQPGRRRIVSVRAAG